MSVAEFSSLFKNRAFINWFNSPNNKILKGTTDEFRSSQQIARVTDLLVTKEIIENVLVSIGSDISQVDSIFAKFKVLAETNNLKFEDVGKGRIIVKNITNNSSSTQYNISKILQDAFSDTDKSSLVRETFQGGHVFGVATNLLKQAEISLSHKKNIPEQQLQMILGVLDELAKTLEAEDLATSNNADINYDVYSRYEKNPYNYLVEIQLKEDNQASGRAIKPYITALRNNINISHANNLAKVMKSKSGGVGADFIHTLMNAHGSPSFIDLMAKAVTEALSGKSKEKLSYTIPNTKVSTIPILVDTSIVKKEIRAKLAEVNNAKSTVKKEINRLRNQQGRFVSLTNIKNMINLQLMEQVAKNMGKGTAKSILNFRTGRFAASAHVEQLVRNKDASLTAYYTYLKYPYATFELGGRQGYPESRDPRLLISKSIRQLAAQQMAERLKTICV